MMKKLLPLSIVLVATGNSASADNFYPFQARAAAMGNTGVASARSSGAPFYNPSMLAKQSSEKDFEILLPILGVIAADDDELIDSLEEIDDEGYVDNFTNAVDSFNMAIENNDLAGLPGASDATIDSLIALDKEIVKLDESTLRANLGAGITVAIPSKSVAMAFSATSHASISARFNYEDSQTVTKYTDGLDELTADYIANTVDPNDPLYADLVEIDPISGDLVLKDPTINSEIEAVALTLSELAISFAHEFNIAGADIALGITPKYVRVTTYDYTARVVDEGVDGTEDVADDIKDTKESDSNMNIDIGAAWQSGNWTTGLAIRNLLSQDYKTIADRSYKLKPHARVGGAYSGGWFNVAADLDLTEQDGLFEDQETQFLATGVEFDLADIVQLRAGYNHNLSDTDTSMWSLGMGLSPGGVMIELAVTSAPKIDAVGGTLQFGFRF
jgi:hypothetical protein